MSNANRFSLLLILAVAGLLLALGLAGLLLREPDAPAKEPAPEFTLQLFDGGQFRSADYAGKPLLVNFFASWCMPCKEEMPALEAVYRQYQPKGVVFVGIAVDDSEEKARQFVAEFDLSFPAGFDATGQIKEAFRLYGIPTTFFIGKDGKINYLYPGKVNERLLQHELDKLL